MTLTDTNLTHTRHHAGEGRLPPKKTAFTVPGHVRSAQP
jgi:hypothetical protein